MLCVGKKRFFLAFRSRQKKHVKERVEEPKIFRSTHFPERLDLSANDRFDNEFSKQKNLEVFQNVAASTVNRLQRPGYLIRWREKKLQ